MAVALLDSAHPFGCDFRPDHFYGPRDIRPNDSFSPREEDAQGPRY